MLVVLEQTPFGAAAMQVRSQCVVSPAPKECGESVWGWRCVSDLEGVEAPTNGEGSGNQLRGLWNVCGSIDCGKTTIRK